MDPLCRSASRDGLGASQGAPADHVSQAGELARRIAGVAKLAVQSSEQSSTIGMVQLRRRRGLCLEQQATWLSVGGYYALFIDANYKL